MYMRNFGDGFGLPWQTVFQTTEKAKVEAYCRIHDIKVEWKEGERLRTYQVAWLLLNILAQVNLSGSIMQLFSRFYIRKKYPRSIISRFQRIRLTNEHLLR